MPRRLPTFLRPTELDRLLAAAEKPRDRLILSIGLYLGLRVSEITKLRIEQVDLERACVFVSLGKGQKDRYVPIPAKLLPQLTEWIGEKKEGVLLPSPRGGGPLSTRMVQRMIKRVAAKAGIVDAGKPRAVSPHKLRHEFASRLMRTVADLMTIKDLLGHSSIATTQIYLHTDPDRLRDAVERL